MLSQKTKNIFLKTNALKEKFSTKNENKQKNGEEFMQNQTKKQQFDKNCSAVSPKLLSSLVSSFTKPLSSLGKSSAVSPNC